MTEVKKVRVEKTLEVPIGEVVPVTKTGRPSISTTSRSSVMVGNEIRQGFPVATGMELCTIFGSLVCFNLFGMMKGKDCLYI